MTAYNTASGETTAIAITVELFGTARLKAGVSAVPLRIDPTATMAELSQALSRECPALLGNALTDTGAIADGYALNRNGLAFLASDPDAFLHLESGDTLLLLSNQAGG